MTRAPKRQRARGNIARDDRAGGDISAVADLNRRYQLRAGADEGAFADFGFGFFPAVVVAGDGAGADVRARADFRVAKVGQMPGFDFGADARVFHFNEVSDFRPGGEDGSGAQTGEGSDFASVPQLRLAQMGKGMHDDIFSEDGIFNDAVLSDAAVFAEDDFADEKNIGVDIGAFCGADGAADVDAEGVGELDAAGEEFFGFAFSQRCFGAGEVGGGVDSHRLLRRASDGADGDAVAKGEGGQAGEVDFAGFGGGADAGEGAPQPFGGRAHCAGIRLRDFFVLRAGVSLFGDVDDFVLGVSDDASVSGGVVGAEGQKGKRLGMAREFSQLGGCDEGGVGEEDEDGSAFREEGNGLRGGVSGPAGLLLEGEDGDAGGAGLGGAGVGVGVVGVADGVGGLVVVGVDDDGNGAGFERLDGVQHAGDKGFSGEFREGFGAVGAQTPAFPGGEYDDTDRHGKQILQLNGVKNWRF